MPASTEREQYDASGQCEDADAFAEPANPVGVVRKRICSAQVYSQHDEQRSPGQVTKWFSEEWIRRQNQQGHDAERTCRIEPGQSGRPMSNPLQRRREA